MPIFAVRSLDGQLGVVVARNKVDAVERLDEFANFEGCPIRELPELMLLLDMDDEGQFRLEHIGEQMDSAIRTFGYPLVEKVFDNVLDQQEAGQRDPVDWDHPARGVRLEQRSPAESWLQWTDAQHFRNHLGLAREVLCRTPSARSTGLASDAGAETDRTRKFTLPTPSIAAAAQKRRAPARERRAALTSQLRGQLPDEFSVIGVEALGTKWIGEREDLLDVMPGRLGDAKRIAVAPTGQIVPCVDRPTQPPSW